jgi:hypothetical protein
VKTVNLTPTWQGILPVLCTLIKQGGEGERTATLELDRLCRAADAQIAVKPTSTPAADEPRVMVSFGEIAETINRDDLTMEQGLTPAQREDAERRLAVALYELIGSNLDRLASIALTEARNR